MKIVMFTQELLTKKYDNLVKLVRTFFDVPALKMSGLKLQYTTIHPYENQSNRAILSSLDRCMYKDPDVCLYHIFLPGRLCGKGMP